MSRLSQAFEKARAEDRAALMGSWPAGFPDVEGGIRAITTMVEAGCDIIEIGLPAESQANSPPPGVVIAARIGRAST